MTVTSPAWSKKLSFSLIVLACGTALAWKGTITAEDWISLTKATTAFYVGTTALVDIIRPKVKADGVKPG